MKKIISFVFRAFIVFLPLEIGIIGLGLVAICYNYEYNIIIEMGLIIFGLTIFIIGMFSWIIWLFVLDDSEHYGWYALWRRRIVSYASFKKALYLLIAKNKKIVKGNIKF